MNLPKLAVAFALSLASLSLVPHSADARPRSVYTDVDSCKTLVERQDEFQLECKGPGGTKAILQYIEGRVGFFYLPSMANRRLELSDTIELDPDATRAFGKKIEWRIGEGASTPCAAILRVFSRGGQRLSVADLQNGELVAMVKSNAEAQAMADRRCRGDAARVIPSSLDTSTEASSAKPASSWAKEIYGPAATSIQNTVDAEIVQCQMNDGSFKPCALGPQIAWTSMFYGDFSGDGRDDAVAFFVLASDGGCFSGDQYVAAWRNDGKGYTFVGKDRYAYSFPERVLAFSKDRLDYTTVTLGPGDPHCFPSLQKPMHIDLKNARLTWAEG